MAWAKSTFGRGSPAGSAADEMLASSHRITICRQQKAMIFDRVLFSPMNLHFRSSGQYAATNRWPSCCGTSDKKNGAGY
jgi:hypothetical protein